MKYTIFLHEISKKIFLQFLSYGTGKSFDIILMVKNYFLNSIQIMLFLSKE